MIVINIQNVEELIFFNKEAHALFPDSKVYFDQWTLAQRIPSLRSLGKRSVIDFLNSVTDEGIERLESYFEDSVALELIDYHIVKTYSFNVEDTEEKLNSASIVGYNDFNVSRNKNIVNITFWR
jgi:hypothetical protein